MCSFVVDWWFRTCAPCSRYQTVVVVVYDDVGGCILPWCTIGTGLGYRQSVVVVVAIVVAIVIATRRLLLTAASWVIVCQN